MDSIIVAAVVALICTLTSFSVFKWSSRINISKNNTTGVRFASQSKPVFGGFIFLAGCLAGTACSYIFTRDVSVLRYLSPLIIAFIAGLADDLKNTPPGFKLLTQFITGLCIYYSGLMPFIFDNPAFNLALCVVWTVTLMNSLNMLDNMDSITSVVSAIILFCAIASAVVTGNRFDSLPVAISLFVSVLIFLFVNWHPAKMYMGDNGSQLLGAGVAVVTLQSFCPNHSHVSPSPIPTLAGMAVALIIPLTDTATVSINRIMDGKSPFVGDKNHTTHNLFYLGFKIRTISLIFIALTLATNIIAYSVTYFIESPLLLALSLISVLIVSILLYSTTKISKPNIP